MKIVLVFPPVWQPYEPYLSLPSLTAYLRQRDIDVVQLDVNLASFNYLLKPDTLRCLDEKMVAAYERAKDTNAQIDDQRLNQLRKTLLKSSATIRGITEAKRVMRSANDFFDPQKLELAERTIDDGCRMVSLAHVETEIRPSLFQMKHRNDASAEILQAIGDRDENPFISYYEKETIPAILSESPNVVGLSINCRNQVIPGLTLASMLKASARECHVTIGGNHFTRLTDVLPAVPQLFDLFDSIIVYEGEKPLYELCRALAEDRVLSEVSNLIYREDGEVRVNSIGKCEDINALPTPDFDGLPLDEYFSGERVLPLLTARGCIWRKCAFCDHGHIYHEPYRRRDVGLVADDIATLQSKYATMHFDFVDETLPVNAGKELADTFLDRNLDIKWLAFARLDKEFSPECFDALHRSGCRLLAFGMESGSARILEAIRKGTDPEGMRVVLSRSHAAGIWNGCMMFFGFPTENKQEAQETSEFIFANDDIIDDISAGVFVLGRHSAVYREPTRYGVSRIINDPMRDMAIEFPYETSSGFNSLAASEYLDEFASRVTEVFPTRAKQIAFLYVSRFGKSQARKLLSPQT